RPLVLARRRFPVQPGRSRMHAPILPPPPDPSRPPLLPDLARLREECATCFALLDLREHDIDRLWARLDQAEAFHLRLLRLLEGGDVRRARELIRERRRPVGPAPVVKVGRGGWRRR